MQIVPGRSPHRQINYKGVRRSVPLSHLPSSIFVNTRVFVKDTDKKNFSIHEVAIDKKTGKESAGKRIVELKRISKL